MHANAMSAYWDPLRPGRLLYLARAVRATAAEPIEGVEKIKEKLAARHERALHGGNLAPPQGTYQPDPAWEQRLHELCGAAWPCRLADDFSELWSEVLETMARHGLRVGRRNYGGDDDGDPGLVRAAWCLTRHLPATAVVETGVGHGVSSRVLLEALAANGQGHLWSIDLPPLTVTERSGEIAVAVPEALRGGWTDLRGSSRRRLPGLFEGLAIELFMHDSRHSTRNVLFECERAFAALRPGGFLLVDDIDGNWGFERFTTLHPEADAIVGIAEDRLRLFGLARKPSAP